MATNQYNGVKNLLTPDNHAMVLIDHQYPQLLSVTSHKHSTVSHNVTALAKAAKVFNVPTLLTTGVAEHQPLLKELQAVFPIRSPSTARACARGTISASSIGSSRRGARGS